MADDIYPLGQGNGLISDIINFGLNNIYQYGQRTKASNQKMGQAMADIQGGGSPDISPLVRDAVSTSPLYTGVINWSGMTEPAKAMLQRFGRVYPNMVGAMEKAPQIMEASIARDLPSDVAGSLSKPVPSAHFMEVAPNYADNLYTIGHEMQHSLNAPRVAATNPIDALTIGTLLHDVLPAGNRGSLNTVLSKQVTGPSLFQQLFGGPAKQQLRVTNPNRELMRNAMDEGLAYLGQNAAEGKGGNLVKTLADRLGVNWENPRVTAGLGESALRPLNAFKHGTDPKSALGIINEGLRPGSSISKAGGRDFEGYPVTFDFEDKLAGARDYSSPFGPTMHEGAAKTGQTAKEISKVYLDPEEFQFREDAKDVYDKLRNALDTTGRKHVKIEAAKYDDATGKFNYGGDINFNELRPFSEHLQKTSDRSLQRLFDEHLDNIDNAPEDRVSILRDRLDQILTEMEKRGFGK